MSYFQTSRGCSSVVRAPACHAGGRGFKSRHPRHFESIRAAVAQSVEHSTENARVAGSNPACGTIKLLLLIVTTFWAFLVQAQELALRPYDRIRISSTGSSPWARDHLLGGDGAIQFGDGLRIQLGGRGLSDAALEIQRVGGPALGRVGIALLAPQSGSASIRGAVAQSGTVRVSAKTTLTDLLFIAKPTEAADVADVIVVTALGKTIRVDSEATPSFPMRPGDQVLVPQLRVPNEVLVLGAVKTPGPYTFKSGLTLESVVELAGGLTGHALIPQIVVLRNDQAVSGANWTIEGRAFRLVRGDVVRVPSVENGSYVSVLGHVKNPGLIPFRKGMTLVEIIEAAGGTVVGAGKNAIEVRKVFSGKGKTRKFDLNSITRGSVNDPRLEAADVVFVPAYAFPEPKSSSGFRPVVPPRGRR